MSVTPWSVYQQQTHSQNCSLLEVLLCTPITQPKSRTVPVRLHSSLLLHTQAGFATRTGCLKQWEEDSWILHDVSQPFEAYISALQSLLSLTLVTGTDCEIVTIHCWLQWSLLGPASDSEQPWQLRSRDAQRDTGVDTLSRYRLCSHMKHKTEIGLFSYDVGVYVRQKSGDDSHVIDHIHNLFHLPCIYYQPPSPALWLLIHFYQEPFSYANKVL